jgi:peptidoglycan/xylan/chitin deacetylase (PgdA/CDA1 family)
MMPTPVLFSSLVLSVLIFSSCGSGDQSPVKTDSTATSHKSDSAKPLIQEPVSIADAATILARKQVPILCYHQLRDWKPTDSKSARDYIVPPAAFKQQMKALADSGYTTILPDELYSYLAAGTPLPPKPVMLTFDDTDLDQYSVAWPEMKQYNFKGVFFIMTVSIGRPRYMSKEQIKELSDAGNTIGSHTWDHHNVKKYSGEDWVMQVEKPSRQLEQITGKPVKYFAYPFGLWNPPAIPELKKRGIKAAFQLAEKRDEQDPLYTIRRIIITGTMSGEAMLAKMRNSF